MTFQFRTVLLSAPVHHRHHRLTRSSIVEDEAVTGTPRSPASSTRWVPTPRADRSPVGAPSRLVQRCFHRAV